MTESRNEASSGRLQRVIRDLLCLCHKDRVRTQTEISSRRRRDVGYSVGDFRRAYRILGSAKGHLPA